MTGMTSVGFATNDVDLYPDMVKKWGLSFLITTAKTPEGRPGSLAWAGLANTYFWIDPARDVAGVILMQVLPFADGQCLEAFAASSKASMPGSTPAAVRGRRSASVLSRRGRKRSRRELPSGGTLLMMPMGIRALAHGGADLTELADSYVCGISDAPLLGETIGHSLDKAVRRWGDRAGAGFAEPWRPLDMAGIGRAVDALAAGFLALGLKRGARIGSGR